MDWCLLQYIAVIVVSLLGNFIIGIVLSEYKTRVSFFSATCHIYSYEHDVRPSVCLSVVLEDCDQHMT